MSDYDAIVLLLKVAQQLRRDAASAADTVCNLCQEAADLILRANEAARKASEIATDALDAAVSARSKADRCSAHPTGSVPAADIAEQAHREAHSAVFEAGRATRALAVITKAGE